jgi:hypothetical protein
MDFLNQKLYHGQIIREQYKDKNDLWIITLNSDNGKFTLWKENKKIAETKDMELIKSKIKN